MKKVFKVGCLGILGLFALIVVAALVFGGEEESATTSTETESSAPAADSTETEATEEEPAEEEAAEEPAAETAGIGEEVQVGDVFFTVNEISSASNVGGEYGVTAQSQFTIVNVTVRNEKNEAITVDNNFFKLLSGERTYDSDGSAGIYANEDADFFLTSVNPGVSLTGNVVFDVPADLEAPQLQVQTGFFGTETGVINLQ
ncbi:DUF4352 domain-containing protein [Planococcus sp. SIMBA_160]